MTIQLPFEDRDRPPADEDPKRKSTNASNNSCNSVPESETFENSLNKDKTEPSRAREPTSNSFQEYLQRIF